MHFRFEQRFRRPAAEVQAAYLDPALLVRLASLPKLGRPELLDSREDGELVHRRVRHAFTGHLAAPARAVLDPAKLTWVEESTTDRRQQRTTFRIVPDHYGDRLRASGTFVLEDLGESGAQRVIEGDLTVRTPLVARRVEQAIVSGLSEHAGLEEKAVSDWLEEGGTDR